MRNPGSGMSLASSENMRRAVPLAIFLLDRVRTVLLALSLIVLVKIAFYLLT